MKIFGYLFLWLLGLTACQSESAADRAGEANKPPAESTQHPGNGEAAVTDQFRLRPGQAGSVRVGMTVEELKAGVPAAMLVEKEVNREGQLYPVYEVLNDTYSQETGLVAEPRCNPECRIYRIEVRDRKYQTAEGIGIGSRYGEVREAFPISYASAEEGNVVAVSEEASMSFLFDPRPFAQQQLRNLRPQDIPDSTLVTAILIY